MLSGTATVVSFSRDIRLWADESPSNLDQLISELITQYVAAHTDYYRTHGRYPTLNYLSISAGAGNGAFAAGLLSGWSETGHQPDFAIVSGVSAGALIAPFVFIGPAYERRLKGLFTQKDAPKLISTSFLGVVRGLMGGSALADDSQLVQQITENITPDVMAAIAAEHRKGKRLFIATTNLEAQRGVIWNIGEIANSGNPQALDLIRRIIVASVSIPGVMKPVSIAVAAGGRRYDELHADGGVISQVFLYPMKVRQRVINQFESRGLQRRLYVLRNSKVVADYSAIKPTLFPITFRAIETISKYQGIGDLYRLYLTARRDGIDYNLCYIPDNFDAPSEVLLDPQYMTALFNAGYSKGLQPDRVWLKKPPGVDYIAN
jgi:hypothetical protein